MVVGAVVVTWVELPRGWNDGDLEDGRETKRQKQ